MPGVLSAVGPLALSEPDQLSLFDCGPNVEKLRAGAALFVLSRQAENTRRNYASDWNQFARWCAAAGRAALPASPDTARLFLTAELDRNRAMSTVMRRVAAIVDKHRALKLPSPLTDEVRDMLRGARRARGVAPRQKAALSPAHLRTICAELLKRGSRIALRDRALIALGFAAGLRRSEIAGLELNDLRFVSQGIALTLRRSKTDQEGRGREIGIFTGQVQATCPVRAVQDWLKLRGPAAGPLFPGRDGVRPLSGGYVSWIVKRSVLIVGANPADYGAHSLRAGCVTAAVLAGQPVPLVMQRSGHRSVTTLERYVRTADLFRVDVLAGVV